MSMIKYRVHEVAKDFNVASKVISQILTETVKHADLHFRMVHGILKQPVERILHEFIVPVDGQERDPELFIGCHK